MKRSIVVSLVLGLSAPTWSAAAPTAPASTEAKSLAKAAYDLGVSHFKARRFPAALAQFERAYKLDPAPVLLYNLARCHEETGDHAKAIESYQLYLARSPQATDRTTVEERIRLLRISQRREADRRAAQAATPEPPPAGPAEVSGAADTSGPLRLDRWGYGAMGVGAAGLAVGAVLGVMANGALSDHQAERDDARKQGFADDAVGYQDGANAAFVAGGVLVGIGVGLVVYEALAGDAPAVAVLPAASGAGVAFGGRF